MPDELPDKLKTGKYRICKENKDGEKLYWNGGYWSANTKDLVFDDMKSARQVFNRLFLHASVKGDLETWHLVIECDEGDYLVIFVIWG